MLTTANGLGQRSSAGMCLGLLATHVLLIHQLLLQRMIPRQLVQPLLAPQITPAVTRPDAGCTLAFLQQRNHGAAHDGVLRLITLGQVLTHSAIEPM